MRMKVIQNNPNLQNQNPLTAKDAKQAQRAQREID
jgi:hypothetical protein